MIIVFPDYDNLTASLTLPNKPRILTDCENLTASLTLPNKPRLLTDCENLTASLKLPQQIKHFDRSRQSHCLIEMP